MVIKSSNVTLEGVVQHTNHVGIMKLERLVILAKTMVMMPINAFLTQKFKWYKLLPQVQNSLRAMKTLKNENESNQEGVCVVGRVKCYCKTAVPIQEHHWKSILLESGAFITMFRSKEEA